MMHHQTKLERLKKDALIVLQNKGLTIAAKETGINKGTLSGIMQGKRVMSAERAALILDKFKIGT